MTKARREVEGEIATGLLTLSAEAAAILENTPQKAKTGRPKGSGKKKANGDGDGEIGAEEGTDGSPSKKRKRAPTAKGKGKKLDADADGSDEAGDETVEAVKVEDAEVE